jgi:hypothetical protein
VHRITSYPASRFYARSTGYQGEDEEGNEGLAEDEEDRKGKDQIGSKNKQEEEV